MAVNISFQIKTEKNTSRALIFRKGIKVNPNFVQAQITDMPGIHDDVA